MEPEVWKDIPGYEGLYQASTFGNIRSLNYKNTKKVKNLKGGICLGGYHHVILCRNGIKKTLKVHSLVLLTFVGPRPYKFDINHLDCNRKNNFIYNIEYCTRSENVKYGFIMGRESWMKGLKGSKNPFSKSIMQYNTEGDLISIWGCIAEASEKTGVYVSNISECCRGIRKTAGGFLWKYNEEKNK